MFAEYRGLLFGTLSKEVETLEEHLGEARKLIDLAVDQSEHGLELVPGAVSFTFAGNWKLQLENCSDAYHFTSTHPSYLRVLDRRAQAQAAGAPQSVWDNDRPVFYRRPGRHQRHIQLRERPCAQLAVSKPSPAHPLFEAIDALTARVGEARRDWMFNTRNLTLFPNVQIAENASSQLRIIRPIAPDRTEMLTYCIAPIGESAEARRRRIRQYEDFFNPTGLGDARTTPSSTRIARPAHRAPRRRMAAGLYARADGPAGRLPLRSAPTSASSAGLRSSAGRSCATRLCSTPTTAPGATA